MPGLVRPGLVGRLLRLALGLVLAWMAYSLIRDARGFWDGIDDLSTIVLLLAVLVLVTSNVVNEVTGKAWRWRPALVGLVALAFAVAVGTWMGEPTGPVFGITLWVWGILFATVLGAAFLLAAVLATPGCEMRSYWHLWAKLRGRDVEGVACPGWIDRFDHVRIGGR